MTLLRGLGITVLVVAAVVLQTAVLSQVAIDGVVPDLALVLVVAAALVRGPELGAATGFVAGLAIDLAPPADHVAGRWALALVIVGYLAGRLRYDAASPVSSVLAVGAGSFVGTSVFALSGLLLHDRVAPVPEMLQVIALSVFLDIIIAPLLLPPLLALFRRLRPPRVAQGVLP
ncbi:MAG: rod shape-determining protein MreD [Marmoricola sp.]